MKVAVTVIKTEQISMDEYKDMYYTRVFEDTATIAEINEWCQMFERATIFAAKLGHVKEELTLAPPQR